MEDINLEVQNLIREKQAEGSFAMIQVIHVKGFNLFEEKNIDKLKKIHSASGKLSYLDPLLVIRSNDFSGIYVNIEDLEYEQTYNVDLVKMFKPTSLKDDKSNLTPMINLDKIKNFNLEASENILKVKKIHRIIKEVYYLTEWIVHNSHDFSNLYVEVNELDSQLYNEEDIEAFNIFNKPKKEEYIVTDLIDYIVDVDLYANITNKPKDTKLYIMKNHEK